jgi:hypothetical protein
MLVVLLSLTSADVTTNGSCAGSYSVTRTWTATDSCGNSSTASQTINVQDKTAPVIAALPATSTIDCPATPVFAVATATDACGAFTLTSADVTTNGSLVLVRILLLELGPLLDAVVIQLASQTINVCKIQRFYHNYTICRTTSIVMVPVKPNLVFV